VTGSATLSGTLLTTQTGAPIGGAPLSLTTVSETVQGQTATALTTTAADGRFTFAGAPLDVLTLSMTRPGYITREMLLSVTGSRAGIDIDAIEDVPPFSLLFYRNFARNALDAPTRMRPIERWTIAPSVYLQTTLPDGSVLAGDMVSAIARVATNSVVELSAGHFSVAAIETGPDARAAQTGWITISIVPPGSLGPNVLGNASLGSNTGVIRLVYDPAIEARYQTDFVLHCEGAIVEVADHEIVHAMGFYHAGLNADFQSGAGCPGVGRSLRATYHAAIVYARAPGNIDPDRDVALSSSASRSSGEPGRPGSPRSQQPAADDAVISCTSPLTPRRSGG
jgi:hypothetical protein